MVKQRFPADENIISEAEEADAGAQVSSLSLLSLRSWKRPQSSVMTKDGGAQGLACFWVVFIPPCLAEILQNPTMLLRSIESVRTHAPSVHKWPQSKSASNLCWESGLELIGAEHLPINYLFHGGHGDARARAD